MRISCFCSTVSFFCFLPPGCSFEEAPPPFFTGSLGEAFRVLRDDPPHEALGLGVWLGAAPLFGFEESKQGLHVVLAADALRGRVRILHGLERLHTHDDSVRVGCVE